MHVHSLHENREILAWPLKSLRSGPRREEEESAIMADDAPAGEVRPFIIAEMPASQGNLLVARPPLNHFLDAFASQVGRPIKQHDRLIFL